MNNRMIYLISSSSASILISSNQIKSKKIGQITSHQKNEKFFVFLCFKYKTFPLERKQKTFFRKKELKNLNTEQKKRVEIEYNNKILKKNLKDLHTQTHTTTTNERIFMKETTGIVKKLKQKKQKNRQTKMVDDVAPPP